MDTRRAVACIWHGTDLPSYSACRYTQRDVDLLRQGLQRHVRDSDLVVYAEPPFKGRPFVHEHRGGWSRRLEPFAPEHRPQGSERHVLLDLDLVIVGDSDWLWDWDEAPVGLPRDPYFPREVCSTVVSYNEEGAEIIWDSYQASGMCELRYARGCYSEMALLRKLQAEHHWPLLEEEPEKLLSYKVHVKREVPWSSASIVYFHGHPKPGQLPAQHALRREWERE